MLLDTKWFNLKVITCLLGMILTIMFFSVPAFADDNNKVEVPGLNKTDIAPEGCVSCHKIKKDKDGRLVYNKTMISAEMHRKKEGFALMETIPGNYNEGCISCHEQSFGLMMHETHLGKPDENKFVQNYYGKVGGCLACHKLDNVKDIGFDIKIKQGKVNWSNKDLKQAIKKEESWFNFK